MSITVRSIAFAEGEPIPRRHTGDGEDLSPPLTWEGLPAATRELAMIVNDPDAPTSEPWVHWVIYKLPTTRGGLVEGVPPMVRPTSPPGSIQGRNSWGSLGYQGPALPRGTAGIGTSSACTPSTERSSSPRAWTRRAYSRRSAVTSWPRPNSWVRTSVRVTIRVMKRCPIPDDIAAPTRATRIPLDRRACPPCARRYRTSPGC